MFGNVSDQEQNLRNISRFKSGIFNEREFLWSCYGQFMHSADASLPEMADALAMEGLLERVAEFFASYTERERELPLFLASYKSEQEVEAKRAEQTPKYRKVRDCLCNYKRG